MKLLLLLTLLSTNVLSQSFAIQDRINTQKLFLDTYPLIYPKDMALSDEALLAQLKKEKNYASEIAPTLRLFDKNLPKDYFRALSYWRFINPRPENFQKLLAFILFQKVLILRDHVDSPYNSDSKKSLKLLQRLSGHASLTTQDIHSVYYPLVQEKARLISEMKKTSLFLEALGSTKLFTYSFNENKEVTPYNLSYLGFIPGNKVELISKNDTDEKRIEWINKHQLPKEKSIDFTLDHLNMPSRFFSKGNPMFKKDPIFIKIRDMIAEAKESIFIDIFLLGGTLGATLSKYLIDQTKAKIKKNPNFKVLILHDFASHKNLMTEMKPIFNYIQKEISTDKSLNNHLYLLQANIQRHPSGSPFGLGHKPKLSESELKKMESNPTHFQSKFDHSKIIVVDGNTSQPAAYFGSKNWTDSDGAFYHDDSIYIEGPGAALVQAAYHLDIQAALTTNEDELKWFFYKEQGFSNEQYHKKSKEIMSAFEIDRKVIPMQGNSTVRLSETNVDSRIVNTRQQIIDMIIKAKKTIFMEQQYFYDKYVVDALIKKKIEIPAIEIKIILDPNQDLDLGGLPNTIYLDELIQSGIEVRARVAPPMKLKSKVTGRLITTLNHRKIISVDSKVLMGGSSNITPNSLQGSSREFGAQVFSRKIAQNFERSFLKSWNSPSKVLILDIENFRARLDGKTLSKENSHLINKILSLLLRSKDQLEGRP